MTDIIAFQGERGANSELACKRAFPNMETLPSHTFEDVFENVIKGKANYAMIPIENSVAGRVADIHHLLPESGLFITAEYFQPVNHCLLAKRNISINDIDIVYSHIQALSQCRETLRSMKIQPEVYADTAGAARKVAEGKSNRVAAIASEFAAEIYGLDILKKNIEDETHNTTRFLLLSKEQKRPALDSGPAITTFVFQVRNVAAALYKAMGGFSTNGINMTKLESYQLEGSFRATQFYADIEGHIESKPVSMAFEELSFFSSKVTVLGVYPANKKRNIIY